MNTEAINTLRLIGQTINDLQKQMNDDTLTKPEMKMIAMALHQLTDAEDIIINEALQGMVEKLNSNNEQLKELIAKMEAESERIAKLAETVKKTSKVIGVLAEITGKALSAGLL